MGEAEIRALVEQVRAKPDDLTLRKQAAEALDLAGQRDDALAMLEPFVNLTGHDDDVGLPCLCKRCVAASPASAEAGELRFRRSFAVTGTRVLHFWTLVELEGERRAVRDSVARALEARLAAQRARR